MAPRLRVGALLEGKETGDSAACVLLGVDLEKERNLNDCLRVTAGRLFNPGAHEIVLPETIAANIGAGLGDEIIIYLMTEDGYLNYDLLTVAGFLELSLAALHGLGRILGLYP